MGQRSSSERLLKRAAYSPFSSAKVTVKEMQKMMKASNLQTAFKLAKKSSLYCMMFRVTANREKSDSKFRFKVQYINTYSLSISQKVCNVKDLRVTSFVCSYKTDMCFVQEEFSMILAFARNDTLQAAKSLMFP